MLVKLLDCILQVLNFDFCSVQVIRLLYRLSLQQLRLHLLHLFRKLVGELLISDNRWLLKLLGWNTIDCFMEDLAAVNRFYRLIHMLIDLLLLTFIACKDFLDFDVRLSLDQVNLKLHSPVTIVLERL